MNMTNTYKCSEKNCQVDVGYLISTVDNGKELLALCPNHAAQWVYSSIVKEPFELTTYPTELNGVSVHCEICQETHEFQENEKNEAYLYKTKTRDEILHISLCKNHLYRLLKRDLAPEDFHILKNHHGIFHEIHDDFYDEDGIAMQPMEIL